MAPSIGGSFRNIPNEADLVKAREENNVQYFRTSSGVVYGFVKDGVVYLDSEKFDTSAPVHEYVHIWVEAVRKAKPELWARGVELLKQHIRLWNDIKNHPAYSNIAHDDNLIASEMLARLSGNEADRIFSELQRKGRGKLADKIKYAA